MTRPLVALAAFGYILAAVLLGASLAYRDRRHWQWTAKTPSAGWRELERVDSV